MHVPEQRRPVDEDEVILEFTRIGALVRVSAMEPTTLIEVVIQGPATAGEAVLRRAVLMKLERALHRSSA